MVFAAEMDGIELKAGIWFGDQGSLCIHSLPSGAGRKPTGRLLPPFPHKQLLFETWLGPSASCNQPLLTPVKSVAEQSHNPHVHTSVRDVRRSRR